MGIFDRIGDLLKSYLNDEDERIFGKHSEKTQGSKESYDYRGGPSNDPDVEAAFDELNEFLNRGKTPSGDDWGAAGPGRNAGAGGKTGSGRNTGSRGDSRAVQPVPESLRPDFAELGLPFGASADDCKTAYKRLLKLHHPDRHAGHAGNMKKATEKSARINVAFDRIERWRQTGRAE
jgi:hypothetical protein